MRTRLHYGLWWFLVVSGQTLATPLVLPPGLYVGPGQGTTDVLRVAASGKTATLGATPVPQGVLLKPALVQETASFRHGAYAGTLQPDRNRILLTLRSRYRTQTGASCHYLLTPAPGGWRLHSGSPACSHYHGFAWGFSTGAEVLRPYTAK